ncbi:MAG: DUF4058 family protein [Cyanothece sp. SIO1E1]|nr:DUF4058 family protein [Cyanothece sp. SIO1E1]
MPSPFPGMNPYLEHPALWAGIHHRLITAIAHDLEPQIQPRYIVAIEERVYQMSGESALMIGIPDVSVQKTAATNTTQAGIALANAPVTCPVEVTIPLLEPLTEGYLEIRAVATGEVITVIEVLSPKNKQSTVGRMQYEVKRQKVFSSSAHFIEIDLLRQGRPMSILGASIESYYRILVSRGNTRPKADLYAFNLPEQIPHVPLPLNLGDTEPLIDLQRLINEIYDQGGYSLRVNYQQDPKPPLPAAETAWINDVLKKHQLR